MENTQEFIKAAMPFAFKIAQEQDADDAKQVLIANDIVQDALLETPLTPDGQMVRQNALSVLDGSIVSPFAEEQKAGYDYTQLRTDTTVASVNPVFKIIAKYADLVPTLSDDKEAQDRVGKAYNDCSLEIFKLLNENNVRMDDYAFLFNVIKTMLSTLEGVIDAQVQGHKNEIFSRMSGAKNPGNDKYDGAFATYADLTKLLESVRKETGNNMEDYFTITK